MQNLIGLLPRLFESEADRAGILGVGAGLQIGGQILRGGSVRAQGVGEQTAIATVFRRLRQLDEVVACEHCAREVALASMRVLQIRQHPNRDRVAVDGLEVTWVQRHLAAEVLCREGSQPVTVEQVTAVKRILIDAVGSAHANQEVTGEQESANPMLTGRNGPRALGLRTQGLVSMITQTARKGKYDV